MLRNKPFWITLSLLVIYLLAGYFAGPRLLQPRLEAWVAEALGYTLSYESLRFDPLTLSANIHGARMMGDGQSPWPEISVMADTVHVRFNFWKLKPAVSELLVKQPLLVPAANGAEPSAQPGAWLGRWRAWQAKRGGQASLRILDRARWRLQHGRVALPETGSDKLMQALLDDVNLQLGRMDKTGSRSFELQLGSSLGSRIQARGLSPTGQAALRGEYQAILMGGSFIPAEGIEAVLPDGVQASGLFQLDMPENEPPELRLSDSTLQAGRAVVCWNRQLLCSGVSPVQAGLDAHGRISGGSVHWQAISMGLQGFELQLDMSGKQLELLAPAAISSARFSVQRRQPLAQARPGQPGSFDLSLETGGRWTSTAAGVFDRAAKFVELEFSATGDTELNGVLRLRERVGLQANPDSSLMELELKNPRAWLAQDSLQQFSAGRASAGSLGVELEASQSALDSWVRGTVSLENVRYEDVVTDNSMSAANAPWLLALWLDPERRINIPWSLQLPGSAGPVPLAQSLSTRVQSQLQASLDDPFSVLGGLLAQQPDLPHAVMFTPGNAAVNGDSSRIIAGLAAILSQRPLLALRVPAVYDPLIDRTALQAEQVRTHIALAAAAEAEFQTGAAETDFRDPVVHSVMDEFARRRLPPKVLEAFFDQFGPADVDNGVMPEGDVEAYYARLFELLVEYAEIPQTALGSLARYRAQAVIDDIARRGVARERLRVEAPPRVAQASLEGVPVEVGLDLWPGSGSPDPAPSTGAESPDPR